MLTCICTMQPSRSWSIGVEMLHRPPLKTVTYHKNIVPNMCSNSSICASSFLQAYNATPFKWLKLFNSSIYSSAGSGCTLEWILQTPFTSQSTKVTAFRVKTEGTKKDFLSADNRDKWITNTTVCTYYTLVPMNTVLEVISFFRQCIM